MGRVRRSRVHNARRDVRRACRTRVRTRDLDLIQGIDMKPERKKMLEESQELNEELPGLGQYYDVECAKYFETELAMRTHKKGGNHKRRLKELAIPAYTVEESLRASGQSGVDNRQRGAAVSEAEGEMSSAPLIAAGDASESAK